MTPEELIEIETQAQAEIDSQGHSASPFAIALLHQRDALSHLVSGIVFSPTCSGCQGLQQRADNAERQLRNAEAAVSSTVAEVQRLRDNAVSLDVENTSLRQTVSDLEAQRDSLAGENAAHLDTITRLEARIAELEGEGEP
jgi:septal ring factor EnvC (AmiA/AmiB activator)